MARPLWRLLSPVWGGTRPGWTVPHFTWCHHGRAWLPHPLVQRKLEVSVTRAPPAAVTGGGRWARDRHSGPLPPQARVFMAQ